MLIKECLYDKTSSFENLSEKDGSVSIYNRNLQDLATVARYFIINYERYV